MVFMEKQNEQSGPEQAFRWVFSETMVVFSYAGINIELFIIKQHICFKIKLLWG